MLKFALSGRIDARTSSIKPRVLSNKIARVPAPNEVRRISAAYGESVNTNIFP